MVEERKNQYLDITNDDISYKVRKIINMIENDAKTLNVMCYYMIAQFTEDELSEFRRYIRYKKYNPGTKNRFIKKLDKIFPQGWWLEALKYYGS